MQKKTRIFFSWSAV